MAAAETKSAELVTRLERLPFSRWHRNFFVLAFLGIMFDAADFALFGAALPPIAREFGLGPAQAGLLATVGLVGAFLGALFWGTISDYIGRRTAFSATVGIFALFTGLVAASWNVASLAVFRFLSNFGLGGEVPAASAGRCRATCSPPFRWASHSPPSWLCLSSPIGAGAACSWSAWCRRSSSSSCAATCRNRCATF
jgi:hypothetical protein